MKKTLQPKDCPHWGLFTFTISDNLFSLDSSVLSFSTDFQDMGYMQEDIVSFIKGLSFSDFLTVLELDPEQRFVRFCLSSTVKKITGIIREAELDDAQKSAVYQWLTDLEVDRPDISFVEYAEEWAIMPNTLSAYNEFHLSNEEIFSIAEVLPEHYAVFVSTKEGEILDEQVWKPFLEQL